MIYIVTLITSIFVSGMVIGHASVFFIGEHLGINAIIGIANLIVFLFVRYFYK